jgi:hypothetical protein
VVEGNTYEGLRDIEQEGRPVLVEPIVHFQSTLDVRGTERTEANEDVKYMHWYCLNDARNKL